jgi:hypothetical protein
MILVIIFRWGYKHTYNWGHHPILLLQISLIHVHTSDHFILQRKNLVITVIFNNNDHNSYSHVNSIDYFHFYNYNYMCIYIYVCV